MDVFVLQKLKALLVLSGESLGSRFCVGMSSCNIGRSVPFKERNHAAFSHVVCLL